MYHVEAGISDSHVSNDLVVCITIPLLLHLILSMLPSISIQVYTRRRAEESTTVQVLGRTKFNR